MFYRPKTKWLTESFDKDIRKVRDESWPKITIITPSYNQGQFIEETIQSVLCQNYPNLEYFIYDGGSNDNTLEVIMKYEEFVDFWVSESDKGQSDAINKGFVKATGDIVGWLNSDDLLLPGSLVKVANLFKSKGNYNTIFFGEGDYLLEKYNLCMQNYTARLSKKHSLSLCDYVIQPSCFWGKNVIDEIGLLSENLHFGFDWEWFIRAEKAGFKFEFIKDNFSTYRIHKDHKSSSAGDKRTIEIAKVFSMYNNEDVSLEYMKIHKSGTSRFLRKIGKYLPLGSNVIRWVHWKLFSDKIDFKSFKAIANM